MAVGHEGRWIKVTDRIERFAGKSDRAIERGVREQMGFIERVGET